MKIYVSDDLCYIKEQLKNRGYSVTNESSNIICDAIICNLKSGGLTNININNSIKREGTLIIDSGSKSVEEIEYILNNRTYSNLL
ncbi:YkuS family protein [Clostridium sp. CX1]|uniref:YkuS family protein n=1 Tax=Clostridium tanneri TaxID=3037988 RepID=A0ABU4JY34_9CLOT|nr:MULTISPECIES: YkuS family protein [unclassified Clostridium]MCT8977604.1 YkuS family protein [Clostridium sp. CX1]MDW8802784.1 YkuS family protein [Clostridium sp. A1-XYC3]